MTATPCFVIAEIGVNHNGQLDLAKRLIDVAAKAGADAVKFQAFSADAVTVKRAPAATYQEQQTGISDQHQLLKDLEFSAEQLAAAAAHCGEVGIEFMCTAFDRPSHEVLLSLGIERVKVPSGELTNLPFIRWLAQAGLPMIVSTGMGDVEEIRTAIDAIGSVAPALLTEEQVTILHCTSVYPAPAETLNLRAITSLADRFSMPIGYSDHSAGISAAPVAVALGATVLEKHITLDRALPGPDHAASLEPDELAQMVTAIRYIEQALGDGRKVPCAEELEVRKAVRRSVVAAVEIAEGTILGGEHLDVLRPGTGIEPDAFDRVVGQRTTRTIPAGTPLQWSDLSG